MVTLLEEFRVNILPLQHRHYRFPPAIPQYSLNNLIISPSSDLDASDTVSTRYGAPIGVYTPRVQQSIDLIMADKPLFVNMSVHRPHPEKERLLIESMHRYGEAARHQKGLLFVCPPLKDTSSGELVGIAIWDSEEAFHAAGPALMKATEKDDFDSWEMEPIRGRRLKPA